MPTQDDRASGPALDPVEALEAGDRAAPAARHPGPPARVRLDMLLAYPQHRRADHDLGPPAGRLDVGRESLESGN